MTDFSGGLMLGLMQKICGGAGVNAQNSFSFPGL